MSRYTAFITDRLNEDPGTIPAPVVAALRSLAALHTGIWDCDGCGIRGSEEAVRAEECEQAHEIAAIWANHPDYPGTPEQRACLLGADQNGRLSTLRSRLLVTAGLAYSTPDGVYLTPRGRGLLPTDHPAAGCQSSPVCD